MTGRVTLIRGDALGLPIADATVDLVVTSPPYFGLRSYQDGGEHYAGQLGSEATPAEFVDALVAATREMVRVLKPSGSIFVNLGDKYVGSDGGGGFSAKSTLAGFTSPTVKGRQMQEHRRSSVTTDVRTKSLMGIPWRYALRCIDDLGLILRAEIIWSKPNGLPESVTDRVRRSHEQWFHFTRSPRYFSAVDEVREGYSPNTPSFLAMKSKFTDERTDAVQGSREGVVRGRLTDPQGGLYRDGGAQMNPLGKLPGSVWTIPTQPLTVPPELGVDHFAAFPMEWPRRIIRGWAPTRGVCVACGEGRRPVVAHGAAFPRDTVGAHRSGKVTAERGDGGTVNNTNGQEYNAWRDANPHVVTGYACACPAPTAPTTPARILDPFSGTGTTTLVAKAHGCHGIGVDMSSDYNRLAAWRTTNRDQLAAAAQVTRSDHARAADNLDMDALFDLDGSTA